MWCIIESFLDDEALKTCHVKNALHAYKNERLQFILVKFLKFSQQWKEKHFETFEIFSVCHMLKNFFHLTG